MLSSRNEINAKDDGKYRKIFCGTAGPAARTSMTGVDATETVVRRGRQRCEEEGIADRVRFVLADVCDSGLPTGSADFVWGEDAWCYVTDKEKLIAEAARVVKPGGTIAFTDWVEGPAGLSDAEAERFLRWMKFANLQDISGYTKLLEENGCTVLEAEDTGRFAEHTDLNPEDDRHAASTRSDAVASGCRRAWVRGNPLGQLGDNAETFSRCNPRLSDLGEKEEGPTSRILIMA